MARNPLSSFYEDMDRDYDSTSVFDVGVLSGIAFVILANLNYSSETKSIEQESSPNKDIDDLKSQSETNYGLEDKGISSCRGVSSPLMAQYEEETNKAMTEA